ncbi:MAG: histidinol-phosphate transaminase [Acidobacteriota bacterium]|nr:histidinol-phosphate transaminase [Acidobacteriota bacterium]
MSYIKNSILKLEPYSVPGRPAAVKLNQNESPFDWPPAIKEKIFKKLDRTNWNRYPREENTELLTRLADYAGHSSEGILLGNGSNELIQTIICSFASKGDRILTVRPGFSIYKRVATILDIEIIEINLKPDFSFDLQKIIEQAQAAGLIFLTSPNNPTGSMMGLEDIDYLLQKVDLPVILDEAYVEFSGITGQPLLKNYENLIILRTFSKAFGLAGARLGYLLGAPSVVNQLKKARLPFSVGLFQQTAAEILLAENELVTDLVEKIKAERKRIYEELLSFKVFKALPSSANFFLLESSTLNAREVFNRLLERDVLVRWFDLPEFQNKVRVTVGSPAENDFLINKLRDIEKEVTGCR